MKIIINADDLGISIPVNKAIEAAIIGGNISSATILANGPAFDDAIRIAKQNPSISYGVHLNIIEFTPLTNSKIFDNYGLLNDQGSFIDGAVFVLDEFSTEIKNAIYEEWIAQIKIIKESGISISHIDSHQHTHGIFELKDVLFRVMNDSKIKKVRRLPHTSILAMILNSGNKNKIKLDKSKAITKPKKIFLFRRLDQISNTFKYYNWIKQFKKKFKITDNFMAYNSYVYLYNTYYKWFQYDTIELMCHPGHEAYKYETENVMHDELSKYIDYQLCTYNDIQ